MPLVAAQANGRTSAADPFVRVRNGQSDDTSLFSLFAELAREAGRNDLYAEFTRRAVTGSAPLGPPAAPAHPDAERRHQDGCRLVREGKLVEAERAFRETIGLDREHVDAHGN